MKTRTMQLVVPILLATGATAFAQANGNGDNRFRAFARMSSFNEVPAIATGARGSFRATLNEDGTVLSFELRWSGLSGAPAFAHVHLGQLSVNGAVSFFLCGGGGQPDCPQETSGMIRGTVTADNVMAVPAQGLQAGNLRQILDAMRRGATYANIHTPPQFAGGEARGQISVRGGNDNNGSEE